MNILITGATGYIGSNLVERLLNDNNNLFCTLLDNEENPFGETSVKSIKLNSISIEEAINIFEKNEIDGIIHLASYVLSGNHTTNDITKLIDSNIKFGSTILEIATKSRVKWFINTGSYWQNYENDEYSPVNLYAATKQAFEDIAKYYYETCDFIFCTIRLFDTYGKNDMRNKIFNLWNKIAKTGEIIDMTPGNQIMDFSYIDDIVEAYVLLSSHLQNKSKQVCNGDIFYLQSPERYSLKELSGIFEEVTSTKLNINWGGRAYKCREIMEPIISKKVIPEFKHKVDIRNGIKKIYFSK